jgi:phosphoglycerate kinase
MIKIPSLKNLDLKHKRVFVRADLNVPLENKRIIQDHRLESIIPTIKYIQENGGKIILATHIGRPQAQSQSNFFDKNLSTEILAEWFKQKGFNVRQKKDLIKAELFSHENFSEILLLENLRFFNGEQGNPKEREIFANLLRKLADIYVNDAFALIHRDDTSVTLLPEKFEVKAFGFLVEKEIQELSKLKENPAKPFIIVLGGNKIKDKIELLENFLNVEEKNRPNSIIIGGAIAYTFLKAQGFNLGKSIVENEFLDFTKNFLKKAQKQNINILLPLDHLVTENNENLNYCTSEKIPANGICVDIGPETINFFEKTILSAKTIFANGSMGIYTKPEFAVGTQKVLQTIADSSAYKVAGGGDCVAAVEMFKLESKFNFLSTGGGATLAFLGAKNPWNELPALRAF